MRLLLAALLVPVLCVPVAAKKRPRPTASHARSIERARAERDKARAEADRAEAELAEVRSGQLTKPAEPDRDFPTQQAEDSERPPSARR